MSLIISELHHGALILTLNDPSHRNMLSSSLCAELSNAVTSAADNPDVGALVITGAAPAFCAGADLKDLVEASEGRSGAVEAVYKSFMDVAMSPLPTLAAVNGPAVGAGFNLALACDMRIASQAALFDTRFLKLRLHPGGGHAWMLLRAVGWSRASKLLLGGRSVGAEEAERIGLVEEVVPNSELLSRALDLLHVPMAASRELIVRIKATMRLAVDSSHHVAFAHETAEQKWSLEQPAFAQSIAAARRS